EPQGRAPFLIRQCGVDESPDLKDPPRRGEHELDEGGYAQFHIEGAGDRREVQLRELPAFLEGIERCFEGGENVVVEIPTNDRTDDDADAREDETAAKLPQVFPEGHPPLRVLLCCQRRSPRVGRG